MTEHTPDLVPEPGEESIGEVGARVAAEREERHDTPVIINVDLTSGADPLSVTCPDCAAPAGAPCRTHLDTHAERQRYADLRALEQGTCALCGRLLVRGSVEGSPEAVWHPYTDDAKVCPPMPDPSTEWNDYAALINAGVQPGHPGAEHFIPVDTVEPATEPEA